MELFIPYKTSIIFVSRFDESSIPVCITLQRFRQISKELICNLHYTDEDQKSETIVYSYQAMEKILIWFEKKNPQHILKLAVYASFIWNV